MFLQQLSCAYERIAARERPGSEFDEVQATVA